MELNYAGVRLGFRHDRGERVGDGLGIVGLPSDPDAALSLPLIQSLVLGLTVKAIVEGDSDPGVFIPQLIELHEAGKFPFDELITTVPFSKINDGVALQHSGQAVKVVLVHDTDQ